MRKKSWKKRVTSAVLAAAMVVTSLTLSPLSGTEIVQAADLTPEEVTLSTYDIWPGSAINWKSEPTDGTSWNLSTSERYDYTTNGQGVDTTALPSTSTVGIKFGDNGSGSSYNYYETVAALPAGTYTLSTMLMGADSHLVLFIGDDKDSTTYNTNGWNNWVAVSNTFTVTENQENVKVGFCLTVDASGWGYIDQLYISGTKTNTSDSTDTSDAIIKNGDFENGTTNWTLNGLTLDENCCVKKSDGHDSNDLEIWKPSSELIFSISQEVTIPAGTYTLSIDSAGNANKATVTVDNLVSLTPDWSSFDDSHNAVTKTSDKFTVAVDTTATISISGTLPSSWDGMYFDNIKLNKIEVADKTKLGALINKVPSNLGAFETSSAELVSTKLAAAQTCFANENATSDEVNTCYNDLETALNALVYGDDEIYVKKVAGLNDRTDFIKGVDISSYISEVKSGVVYKNQSGTPVEGKEFIKTFAEVGVNYIRLRVWNAPYDLDANENRLYYGGGNNDIDTTIAICNIIKEYNAAYAEQYGEIKVLVDLQYSDFWADPDKQTAPKAWKNMSTAEKAEKVKEFTQDCLAKVEATGVTVGMVQIGNETNTGICGTKYGSQDYLEIFKAGCDAVKDYNTDKGYTTENGKWIKRVVHFTDPQNASTTFAKTLKDGGVEYDVYATSYYPFWHGTPENLKTMLSDIATTCGCEVMVAETQYVYTNQDYDGADNQAYEGKENIDLSQWPVSVQGQANEIRDVINAVAEVGDAGIGMFYWEPGWLGVGNAYNADGTVNETALAANKVKWNTYGSGWASDYAKTYDEQAEKWGGGGTNNENASLFNFTGTPLASLNVFKYVNYGAVAAKKAFYATDAMKTRVVKMGASASEIKAALPASVEYAYNDGSKGAANITWNADSLAKIAETISKSSAIGNYYLVEGTISVDGSSHKVTCEILVDPKENLLTNGGFEDPINGEWKFDNGKVLWRATDDTEDTTYYNKDTNPRNGSRGSVILNTYNSAEEDADSNGCFSDFVSQTVSGLSSGVYEAKGFFEGLDKAGSRTGEKISISVSYGNGQTKTSNAVTLNAWMSWQSATVSNIVITDDMVKAGTNSITVHVNVCLQKDVWGSIDDVYLYQTGTYTPSDNNGGSSSGSISGGSSGGSSSGSISGGSSGGSSSTTAPSTGGTTVTKNPDATTTETKTETTTNEAGNDVKVTVTTEKDKDGNITGSSEVSVIEKADSKTSATVTVSKNADGKVTEATADVTTVGTTSGKNVVGSISGKVVSQITEAAGAASVEITVNVTGSKGKTKYTLTADSEDLTAGNKLKVVAVDTKTGEYVLVNAKTYTVTKSGNVKVTLASGKNYELLNTKDAAAVEKAVLATVKTKKSSATVKVGKSTTVQLSSKLNMDNVAKITYSTGKKSVATVNKNGKVTAKKEGIVTIKAKVTLNNGKTKTVSMKIKVK